jgi:DNA replication protein DnaC
VSDDIRRGKIVSAGEEIKSLLPELEAIRDRALQHPPPSPTPEALAQEEQDRWYDDAAKLGIFRRLWPAKLSDGQILEVAGEEVRINTKAMEYALEYDQRSFQAGRCLVLMGPTSVGKSWAAVALLRQHPEVARRWWYFPDLCQSLLGPESDEAMSLAKRARFVVLDDFGAEYLKPGGALEAKIDTLISFRHGNLLPTVVTTNLTREDFRRKIDGGAGNVSERLLDRFAEWAVAYTCTGENLRRLG